MSRKVCHGDLELQKIQKYPKVIFVPHPVSKVMWNRNSKGHHGPVARLHVQSYVLGPDVLLHRLAAALRKA